MNNKDQLEAEFKRIESAQQALLGISDLANTVNTMQEFYYGLHRHLKQLIPADNFYIALKNQDRLELPFFADEKDAHPSELYPDESLSDTLKRGLTGYVIRSQKPLLCDEEMAEHLEELGEIDNLGSPSHQWFGVPITHHEIVVGVLVVQSYRTEISYGSRDQELMVFISHHIAGVLERLRHQQQLELAIDQRTQELSHAYEKLKLEVYERRRAERLQRSLFEIADLATSNLEGSEFYAELHRVIGHLLPAQNCYIALLSEDNTQLEFPFYVSQLSKVPPKPRALKDGLVEYLIRSQRPMLLDQNGLQKLIHQGEIYSRAPDLNQTQQMKQWIGIPLMIQGSVGGALAVYSFSNDQKYQFKDMDLLTFVSQHIATAIERKYATETLKRSNEELEEKVIERTRELARANKDLQREISQRRKVELQLKHDASHDALTGLPNRMMFMARLQDTLSIHQRSTVGQFALLFIDLDRFKLVNDTLGHLEGDHFLVETSKRLGLCIREQDTLARLGGDEFVILLDHLHSIDDAKDVAERILAELAKPFNLNGKMFNSGASIGIAMSGRHNNETSESLLRDADTAMYMAKTRGKGCYVVFDEQSHQQLLRNISLENELRAALENCQIQLSFAKVESLHNSKEIARDVKLYWQHAEYGLISHEHLLNLAEQANMLLDLDRYTIEMLSSQFSSLALPSYTSLHLTISSQHLTHKHALRSLKNCLRNCQFPLDKLCLFFSELALARDNENHANGFEELRELDVNLGISSFGSGYSSMVTLSFLPISQLKLEPELAHGIRSTRHQRLLNALRLSAESLKIELIVDGVNSQTQVNTLKQMGFVAVQHQLQLEHFIAAEPQLN
ncbi:bifunctional diguanylate cyclase/phosphodiesterase [Shewanella mangrovi]|uniref:bifunctional diguanylate cyclase/phosphodiesterase n=1 Tax=Shewanella mangrovi TaxID=1515746 RepID=UPI000A5798BC|nr:diguanylate cyclase [Shewanella mangrovi]